jgi:hypothetical protein
MGYAVWGIVREVGDGGVAKVTSLSLPGGSFVIFASVSATAYYPVAGERGRVVCYLLRDGRVLASTAETLVDSPAFVFGADASLALSGAMTTAEPTTVDVQCEQGGSERIDFDAGLTAVSVGSIG